MPSPRLGFRAHPLLADAFHKLKDELGVTESDLMRHAVFILLAAEERIPKGLPIYGRSRKTARILERLHSRFPVIMQWPRHIPKKRIKEMLKSSMTRRW